MPDRKPSRLAKLLRLAGRNEQQAAVEHRRSEVALEEATATATKAAENAGVPPPSGDVLDLQQHALRAEIRGRNALSREEERREMLTDEVAKRDELLDAMRRRRSYERLEDRHLRHAAVVASQAAQRALDEIARAPRSEPPVDQ